MTITGIYTQNLTLSFSSTSSSSSPLTPEIVAQKLGLGIAGAGVGGGLVAPSTDTVTLSPEAISKQIALALTPASTPGDSAPAAQASAALVPEESVGATAEPGRGDALFAALDADGDGTVTKDEFVDGAKALLRQADRHGRRHHHGERVDDGERGRGHDGSRLTNRLGRLFDLVDGNGDGGVEKAELADALQQTGQSRKLARAAARSQEAPQAVVEAPASTEAPAVFKTNLKAASAGTVVDAATSGSGESAAATKTAPPQAAAASVETPVGSFVSVTQITITVAIQQYTSVSVAGTAAQSGSLSAAA